MTSSQRSNYPRAAECRPRTAVKPDPGALDRAAGMILARFDCGCLRFCSSVTWWAEQSLQLFAHD